MNRPGATISGHFAVTPTMHQPPPVLTWSNENDHGATLLRLIYSDGALHLHYYDDDADRIITKTEFYPADAAWLAEALRQAVAWHDQQQQLQNTGQGTP
jgi:hypothetical protein